MVSTRPREATRATVALDRLRTDILNGHLAPGTKLAFAELGERYGVSSGVLREVLPRLVEQGLATSEPQLGFRVVTASVAALNELTDARVALETLLTRQAVATADVTWEAKVVAACHSLSRTPQIDDSGGMSPAWIAAHQEFHEAVLRGCGNSYLFDAAVQLRRISEVYRCWTLSVDEAAHRDVAAEHRAIMEAAVGRDAETCVALTEQHIRLTTELLISSRPREQAPDGA